MAYLLRITTVDGDLETSHLLDDDDVVIGSGNDCGLRVGHPAVSRRHARLRRVEGSWTVEDLGSSNGTFIAGRRVEGTAALDAPTTLGFGPVTARVEPVDLADTEPALLLGAMPATRDRASAGLTATTIHGASIQRLVTEGLPRWVDVLESGGGFVELAQAVGASLFEALPLRSLEVGRRTGAGEAGGILYRAVAPGTTTNSASSPPADPEVRVSVEGRGVRCDAHFIHAVQARAYRPLVQSAVRFIDLAQPVRSAPLCSASAPLPEPVTAVPEVRSLYAAATKVAAGDISVLITGESGTGKEVLARYLHRASQRRAGAFVALNCAALSRDLLESELFGIEEGVATGVKSRAGCFERADGGTLFLDEIGDMAPETQASILRVLQEREVFRLGGRTARSADVRILAATNRDIDGLLHAQTFRSDLYHRIADWRVELPPLRRRRADITNLAAHFLARSARKRGLVPVGVSKGAAAALEGFDWPGNIRQLEREIARAVLFLEPGELLQSRHLQSAIRDAASTAVPADHTDSDPAAGRTLADGTLKARLEAAEREILRAEIRRHGGDIRRVSEVLAMGRSTLYRRIREWGLGGDDSSSGDD